MSIKMRIGLQLSEIDTDYSREIVRGITALCAARGASLTVFSGGAPGWPYGHDYQKTAIFSHITAVNTDVLVLASGTQCNYVPPDEFFAQVRALAPLPVISFGVRIPGVPSLYIDNRKAFRTLLDHLADVHGYKRYVFLSGPRNNSEAMERKDEFEKFLASRGLPRPPYGDLYADFSLDSGYNALSQWFGHHRPDCDAIVCANDNMALGAYRYIAEFGLKPGRDIGVIGFDDIARAQFEPPPLTTVRQDVYQQAYKAASYALDMLEGKAVPQESLMPTEPVIRSSCGCLSGTIAGLFSPATDERAYAGQTEYHAKLRAALADFFAGDPPDFPRFIASVHDLIDGAEAGMRDPRHWNNILNDLFREFLPSACDPAFSTKMHIAFQGARSLVSEVFYASAGLVRYRMSDDLYRLQELFAVLHAVMPLDALMSALRKLLEAFGVDAAALVLFGRRITRLRDAPFPMPDSAEVAMVYVRGTKPGFEAPWTRFNPQNGMLPASMGEFEVPFRVARSLYHQLDQLGYIVLAPGSFGLENIEFLCSLVSNALEASLLYTEKLELENRLGGIRFERSRAMTVEYEAYRDEGTGLYNKRGFAAFCEEITELARRMRKGGMILFVEIEGLAAINERYGTDAGDRAIRETARLLKNAFRNLDVVARIEADLFGVLAIDVAEGQPDAFERRILAIVSEWNERARSPFRLKVVVGAVELPAGGDYRLETLFASAARIIAARKGGIESGPPAY